MIFSSLPKHRLRVASCTSLSVNHLVVVTMSNTHMRQHYNVVLGQVYIRLHRVGLGFNRTSKSAHGVLWMFGFVPSVGDCLGHFATTRTFSCECPGC